MATDEPPGADRPHPLPGAGVPSPSPGALPAPLAPAPLAPAPLAPAPLAPAPLATAPTGIVPSTPTTLSASPSSSGAQATTEPGTPAGPTRPVTSAPAPNATKARPWSVLACVLFGLVCATWALIAFSVPSGARGGLQARGGAGAATFLAAFGIALATVSVIRRKRAPTALGGPLAAALAATSAAIVATAIAFITRSFAVQAAATLDPALGAYEIGQAGVAARNLAWFGLAAIPGFSLGALGIIYVHGERKEKKRAAPPGEGAPAASLLALLVVSLLFLGGVGGTIAALVSPVDVVDHPAIPRLREVRAALARGDLAHGCDGLEALLPETAVPRHVLELEIPDYRELATRCITLRIDALPKGLPCTAAAGALLGSELTAAARAEQRVKHACDRPFD